MESSLAELISKNFNIPIIADSRRYWLVRTKGGDYYPDFIEGQFIAIGYNKITESIIKEALNQKNNCRDFLKQQVEIFYPDESRSGLVTGYILNMMQEIKPYDIVIIPDKDSCYVTFGEVNDEPAYFETIQNIKKSEFCHKDDNFITCPYYLRRHITWKKTISKDSIDLHLVKAFFTHNTISNIDAYGYTIDRTLNDLFIKYDEIHYKLRITTTEAISMSSYLGLMYSIKLLTEEFNSFDGTETCDFNNITVKMQAESPGFSEIISSIPQIGDMVGCNLHFIPPVIIVALVIVSLTGGKFKFIGFEFETPGLINKIIEWHKYVKENKTQGVKELERAYNQLQSDSEKTTNVIQLHKKESKKENH